MSDYKPGKPGPSKFMKILEREVQENIEFGGDPRYLYWHPEDDHITDGIFREAFYQSTIGANFVVLGRMLSGRMSTLVKRGTLNLEDTDLGQDLGDSYEKTDDPNVMRRKK